MSKEVKNFNRIFAELLRNLTSAEDLPEFKVSCNQERIVIWLSADQISFSFLAQIIQEIDDFKLSFVSKKFTEPTVSDSLQEAEEDEDKKISKEEKGTSKGKKGQD